MAVTKSLLIALALVLSLLVAATVANVELTDEEVTAVAQLLKLASKARIETYKNTVGKKHSKKSASKTETKADIPGMYVCKDFGKNFYSGSYESCYAECKQHARWNFAAKAEFQVTYFPFGSFSSGGCTCCGPSRN